MTNDITGFNVGDRVVCISEWSNSSSSSEFDGQVGVITDIDYTPGDLFPFLVRFDDASLYEDNDAFEVAVHSVEHESVSKVEAISKEELLNYFNEMSPGRHTDRTEDEWTAGYRMAIIEIERQFEIAPPKVREAVVTLRFPVKNGTSTAVDALAQVGILDLNFGNVADFQVEDK